MYVNIVTTNPETYVTLRYLSVCKYIWNGRNNFRKIELVIHMVLKLNAEDVIFKIEFY